MKIRAWHLALGGRKPLSGCSKQPNSPGFKSDQTQKSSMRVGNCQLARVQKIGCRKLPTGPGSKNRTETGNTTSRVFFVWVWVFVYVCVCARGCGRHVDTMPGEPPWWQSTPSLSAKPRVGIWVPPDEFLEMIAGWSGPFFGHNITSRRKHALWGRWRGSTAKTFLPKKAIHGTTEEARLNSVRGFLCDGNGCRRILYEAISSSAITELVTASHNRRLAGASGPPSFFPPFSFWFWIHSSAPSTSETSWVVFFKLRGSFFLARRICTTNLIHPTLVSKNRDLSRISVCPSY